MTSYLVLDIETVPDRARWSPPVDKPDAFPPTWAHRIVCVGMAELAFNYMPARDPVVMRADTPEAEPGLLSGLSRLLATGKPTLITFNGRKFDLPVIAMRCLCHGVQLPWYYRARGARYRFSEEGHVDLCDVLSDYGAATMMSLDDAARLIGADGKGYVDGSSVETLYRESNYDAIGRYCLDDVLRTTLLFLRYRLVQGELTQDMYRLMVFNMRRNFGQPAILPEPIGAGDLPVPRPDSVLAGALPDTGATSTTEQRR